MSFVGKGRGVGVIVVGGVNSVFFASWGNRARSSDDRECVHVLLFLIANASIVCFFIIYKF